MSMDAYRWALTWGDLKSPQKFVLVMIADHYNDDAHRAWPSVERLSHLTGLHRTSVLRAIGELEDKGLVLIEPWVRQGLGGRLNNRYCLPLYDPQSVPAKRLPVRALKSFGDDGKVQFDTYDHNLEHKETVPSYGI